MTKATRNITVRLSLLCLGACFCVPAEAQSGSSPSLIQRIAELDDQVTMLIGEINSLKHAAVTVQSGKLAIKNMSPRSLIDNSKCDGGSDNIRGVTNERIEFPKAYIEVPSVVISLSTIDIASGISQPNGNHRLRVAVSKADKNGFEYEFYTWCHTQVYGAEAIWIAHGRTNN